MKEVASATKICAKLFRCLQKSRAHKTLGISFSKDEVERFHFITTTAVKDVCELLVLNAFENEVIVKIQRAIFNGTFASITGVASENADLHR